MADVKPPDLFRQAARLLETALIQLDAGTIDCAHCGGKRPRNRAEHTSYQRFTDWPEKLRQAAIKLDEDGARRR